MRVKQCHDLPREVRRALRMTNMILDEIALVIWAQHGREVVVALVPIEFAVTGDVMLVEQIPRTAGSPSNLARPNADRGSGSYVHWADECALTDAYLAEQPYWLLPFRSVPGHLKRRILEGYKFADPTGDSSLMATPEMPPKYDKCGNAFDVDGTNTSAKEWN